MRTPKISRYYVNPIGVAEEIWQVIKENPREEHQMIGVIAGLIDRALIDAEKISQFGEEVQE